MVQVVDQCAFARRVLNEVLVRANLIRASGPPRTRGTRQPYEDLVYTAMLAMWR